MIKGTKGGKGSLFINLHQLTTKHFPDFERFELSSQLQRAAYSVPANIVEGFARRYRRSRLDFLNISESSLAEVWYCHHAAKRLGYITEQQFTKFESASLPARDSPFRRSRPSCPSCLSCPSSLSLP